MKSLVIIAALIVAAGIMAGGLRAQSIEAGKRLFEKDGCYECHGHAAQGGRDGPRIAATGLSFEALNRYIRRPLGSMPAFTEKVLSDQELRDIYAYLKSFPRAKSVKEIPLLNQLQK